MAHLYMRLTVIMINDNILLIIYFKYLNISGGGEGRFLETKTIFFLQLWNMKKCIKETKRMLVNMLKFDLVFIYI